jgi:beta-N-acetylhexosaminidase
MGGVAVFLAACGSAVVPSSSPSSEPSATPPPASIPPSPRASASASAPPPSPSVAPSTAAKPSLAERIAGLLVVGFRGSRLDQTPWIRTALTESGLGGVILFDRDEQTGGNRNVVSPDQIHTLVEEIRDAAGDRHVIVSVDQEGGIVTRLSPTHGFPALASEWEIGSSGDSVGLRWAATMAKTLSEAGINLNFAPVVDLNVNPRSPAIGALDRAFSADPAVVVRKATVEIDALRDGGIRSTLKHFPGIGSSTANTDFGVADVTLTWSRTELEPFRDLIEAGHADLVMAGHVVNGQIDRRRPASLSKATVTGVLRGQLGFKGVVVTDDLQAAAIQKSFGRDEAVVMALDAGNDLLLFANQQVYEKDVVARVVRVVTAAIESGELQEERIDEAWTRVQAAFA